MMPNAKELAYEWAKVMLHVDNVDDRAFLKDLVQAMVKELPAVKKKKTDKG